MASSERPAAEFDGELRTLVEEAIGDGASAHAVEASLQRAAQTAREGRRVHHVYRFECPEADCDASHEEAIDRANTTCGVCYEPAPLSGCRDHDGERILRFECRNGPHATRCRVLDLDEVRCPTHDRLMERAGSYSAEEDLGDGR